MNNGCICNFYSLILLIQFFLSLPICCGIPQHEKSLENPGQGTIDAGYVNNLYDDVRDGVLLCKVINKLASELKNDFNCNIKLLKCSFEFEVSYLIFKTNIFLLTVFYQFLVPQQSCFEP